MPLPSERTVSMLRRAADSAVIVEADPLTGDMWFAYADDGEELRDEGGRLLTARAFCRFVREGWLLPGDDVGLFRARTVPDGRPQRKQEVEVGEQKPTPQQTAILRRISVHKLVVAFVDGRKGYSYGDGVPVRREDAERIIRNRWVVPESPGLFYGEEPQSYVCRSP
jgi:hypothetical protein